MIAPQKQISGSFFDRKLALSAGVIIASALYAFFQYRENQPLAVSIVAQPVQSQSAGSVAVPDNQTPAASAPPPKQTPAPAPAHAPKPAGKFADGTYTGSPADAYYGTIQVEAIIQNGALADVQFLQYPSDRSTSRYINGQAMPYLRQEAIDAQSANVDIVSGATDSSQAFQQSLASALAQAKN